jgi:tetratricopeptide (TPR) repeat protein
MVPDPRQLSVEQAIARAKKAAKVGNERQALQLYRAVLQTQPNHPVAKKACRKLEKALRRKHVTRSKTVNPPPQSVDAVIALYHSGQMDAVVADCNSLLEKFPRSAVVLNLQGAALQVLGRLTESVSAFDKAISLQPDFAEAHSNRGNALKDLGDIDEAIASYDRAIRLNPQNVVAYLNRGNACKDDGRMEMARACYEQAIKLSPGFAEAHRNLSVIKTYERGDRQIAAMEKLLADSSMSNADKSRIHFALAKASDELGAYDAAFAHYAAGNELRKRELQYDIADDTKLFARIKAMFVDTREDDPGDFPEADGVRPVFVVGMMRSGTSLVEQILASHSEVHGAGELELLNRLVADYVADDNGGSGPRVLAATDVEVLRNAYTDMLQSLGVTETVITDKMPANFRWIGFILAAFPGAKIIHVKRDAIATCWSIFRHYFPTEGHGFGYDLQDLVAYYTLYADLMSFWQERFPGRIYELSYEALTAHQEDESRRLLAYCGLDWESAVLRFHETQRLVRTQSAGQVRQAMYQGSSDAWRHYEKHLEVLIKGLE